MGWVACRLAFRSESAECTASLTGGESALHCLEPLDLTAHLIRSPKAACW
jgi:hypothetical protein